MLDSIPVSRERMDNPVQLELGQSHFKVDNSIDVLGYLVKQNYSVREDIFDYLTPAIGKSRQVWSGSWFDYRLRRLFVSGDLAGLFAGLPYRCRLLTAIDAENAAFASLGEYIRTVVKSVCIDAVVLIQDIS